MLKLNGNTAGIEHLNHNFYVDVFNITRGFRAKRDNPHHPMHTSASRLISCSSADVTRRIA